MDAERKVFTQTAIAAAPEGINVVHERGKEIPPDHCYAVVEILDRSPEGIAFAYVATGNREGIIWAWEHAKENHPRPGALQLMDIRAAGIDAAMIDFH